MSNDDPTHNLPNSGEQDNTTQATITAVFRLLREVQDGQTALISRFEALETRVRELQDGQTGLISRFEALETRVREVQDGQTSLNSRFEALETRVREVQDGQTALNSRFDALETRLASDFAAVDARFAEMSEEMKKALLQLSDKLSDRIDRQRMHADADIEDITRRLRKLESKAS